MKRFQSLLFSYLICLSLTCYAQFPPTFEWAFNAINAEHEGGDVWSNDLVRDANGNIYITGKYEISADMDPGLGIQNLLSIGSSDIYLAKYDSLGNFIYAFNFGSTGADEGLAVALDSADNIYLTGYFRGTVDFDPGPGTQNLISSGDADLFLCKFDNSGLLISCKRIGGVGDDRGHHIKFDQQNNLLITGYFSNTVDFDPGAGVANLSSSGSYDLFFAKYDVNGNYVFAKKIGSSLYDCGNRIGADSLNNIYLYGIFSNTADFDPGAGTQNLVSAGGKDIFFAKYNQNGQYIYAKKIGTGADDLANDFIVNENGSILITGNIYGTTDFDPGPGTQTISGAGQGDIFFAKYDNLGGYIFAKAIGSYLNDMGTGITTDHSGNICLTGCFRSTADFDPGPGVQNLTVSGVSDFFLAKYDPLGSYIYAQGMGAAGADQGSEIVLASMGSVITTGFFYQTVDFDPGAGIQNQTSAGTMIQNVYFGSYSSGGSLNWIRALGQYPNLAAPEVSNSIELDGDGSAYITGRYYDSIDFDPGPGVEYLFESGDVDYSGDAFIAKYDSSGNLKFALGIGAVEGNDIAVDSNLNIYVVGRLKSITDMDPGPAIHNVDAYGGDDMFIAKYDSVGNYIWAKSIGGPFGSSNSEYIGSLTLDNDGNIYVTGYFGQTVDFDPGPGIYNITSAGINDVFFAKYDNNGNLIFVYNFGNSAADNRGVKIEFDGHGYIYIVGKISGSADFDPGLANHTLAGTGFGSAFIAKYDTMGSYINAFCLSSTGGSVINSLKVDNEGNIFTIGCHYGNTDFDPGPGVQLINNTGGNNIFVAKYDSNLNYQSVITAEGPGNDFGYDIDIDEHGHSFITGYMRDSVDFDPGIGTHYVYSHGDLDIFIAEYDSIGNMVFAESLGGVNLDKGFGIKAYNNASLYLTGTFRISADFDPDSAIQTLTCSNSEDLFLAKYKPCRIPDIPTISASLTNIACSQDTSILSIVSGNLNSATTWTWYSGSCGGSLIGTGTNIAVVPTITTTYYATGTGACSSPGCAMITITTNDLQAPVPNQINLPVIVTACAVNITSIPTATDNCAGIINGTTTNPLFYNTQGSYMITWNYNDGNGNVSTQNQNIIVNDSIAPIPDNASLPDLFAPCSLSVTNFPTATDNCSGILTGVSGGPLTFSTQGNYAITWTFNDSNGNSTTQQQNILISDSIDPTITPIPNISACQGTIISFSGPVVSDNCNAIITQISGLTSGIQYPLGNTINTFVALDGAGNTDTMSFVVSINPLPLVNLNTSSDTSCVSNSPIILSGIPIGGVYSGNGVTSNFFDPAAGNIGINLIWYTYSDTNGCSSTDTISIINLACTSIQDLGSTTEITYYPNPTKNEIFIKIPNQEKIEEVELLSIDGKQIEKNLYIEEISEELYKIELGLLADATYIINLQTSTHIYRFKIVLKK